MGHSHEDVLAMKFDPTATARSFGVYVRMLERCELVGYVRNATEAGTKARVEEIYEAEERQ